MNLRSRFRHTSTMASSVNVWMPSGLINVTMRHRLNGLWNFTKKFSSCLRSRWISRTKIFLESNCVQFGMLFTDHEWSVSRRRNRNRTTPSQSCWLCYMYTGTDKSVRMAYITETQGCLCAKRVACVARKMPRTRTNNILGRICLWVVSRWEESMCRVRIVSSILSCARNLYESSTLEQDVLLSSQVLTISRPVQPKHGYRSRWARTIANFRGWRYALFLW